MLNILNKCISIRHTDKKMTCQHQWSCPRSVFYSINSTKIQHVVFSDSTNSRQYAHISLSTSVCILDYLAVRQKHIFNFTNVNCFIYKYLQNISLVIQSPIILLIFCQLQQITCKHIPIKNIYSICVYLYITMF